MDYLILMLSIALTFANVGMALFVAWVASELLPEIIEKWRRW